MIRRLSPRDALALLYDWHAWARPSQLPPVGDWLIWLVLAGRGFGKTRTGAEFVRAEVEEGRARRIALVAPTAADARDTMVEGESGILAISTPWCRPKYEPSKRRLTWPNGAKATLFSAEEPERLRGPQHDLAWSDELAAWERLRDAWDMLQFGLRLGRRPRQIVTTTPKPVSVLKEILARPDVAVTRGGTRENAVNLAPDFLAGIVSRYEGTRLGRQELDGEILEDVPGALWAREQLDRDRVGEVPELARIVVAVDPPVSSTEEADECGIIVAGIGRGDKHGYVLADHSSKGETPCQWAARVVRAYYAHEADRIVAEVNQGGEMVAEVIRAVDPSVPIRMVHASRGKALRAEPVSALYAQGRVHHVGSHRRLEDQMCEFTVDFDRDDAGYSPDRLDALVWAITDLMIGGPKAAPRVL